MPAGNKSPGLWVLMKSSSRAIKQLSVAVGGVQLTAASQSPGSVPTTISVGQPLISGGWFSRTVMLKRQNPLFPAPSVVTIKTPVTNPAGKASPELWEGLTVGRPQLSVARIAGQLTTAEHCPGSVNTSTLGGQLRISGCSVSSTVIWNVQVVRFPALSEAE